MPNVEVTATGNVSGAVSALEKLDKALVGVATDAKRIPESMNAAQAALNRGAAVAANFDNSIKRVSKTLGTDLKTGSAQATNALLNFGRVVQDAPFGIIGIANNINPLLESFQRLKAETGSTGGAIKALASGLVGGGGLGLAISVVTSLLTVFALSSQGAGGAAENLSGHIAALKVDFDVAKDSVERFGSAMESLRALRDVNLQIRFPGDGANALKRLDLSFGFNKQEEEQKLKNLLKLEQEAADASSRAFNLLQQKGSNALITLISEQANLNEVKKVGVNLSSKDTQLLDTVIELDKERVKIQGDQIIQRNKIQQMIGQNKLDIDEINKKEAERLKNIRTVSDVLADLSKQMRFLKAKESILNVDETKGKISALEKAFDELIKDFRLKAKNPIIIDIVTRINKLEFDQLSRQFMQREFEKLKQGSTLQRTVGVDLKLQLSTDTFKRLGEQLSHLDMWLYLKSVGVKTGLQDGLQVGIDQLRFPELKKLYTDFKIKLEAFQTMVSNTIENTVVGMATGIGEALGNALAGGKDVVPNLFEGLMSSVGQQVQDLGKFLITSAITVNIAKKAFEKLLANPVAAIAVGIGLVALGALLKAQAAKKYKGFASGGTVGESGVYPVGERGMERVFLPRGAKVQPNNEVTAFGGGSQIFIPAVTLSGSDLVISFNRASAAMNRNN